ncbi:RNA exonuclease 4-like [Anopheles marshallii]|uniref:RNA exonuclease 4-like n=1 Tax=Anopheles marshallii TaxID=1521116 RepID=UPI00237A0D07|nr:RNA exonuclease 4-like [Anopheles marshallii]
MSQQAEKALLSKLNKLSLKDSKTPAKKNGYKNRPICTDALSAEVTNRIALDCEMVGIGADGKEHMLARVSIVNERCEVVIDRYVKPQETVTDYRTEISGIRPEHIAHGVEFQEMREVVRQIIHGKILVGHGLYNDLSVLNLRHPKYNIRDTARYRPIAKKAGSFGTPSLRSITYALLGEEIQDGSHDSVEDARAAMKIYLQFQKDWEKSTLPAWVYETST